ncbi:MAG: hypothetical protein KBD06_02480 [Candidatus Pacebacteria bacterium]|nr:hypothetical protein [Candidatus Paceibacterota bacterium]
MTNIKERHVLYGAIFVLALALIITRSPIAQAITPTGPGLKDGTGAYLGQVLSAQYDVSDSRIMYTTYLPAADGILQFATDNSQGGAFTNYPDEVLYNEIDCTGTAYVRTDGIWINPWIVARFDSGETFKVASSTQFVDIVSIYQNFGGGCTNTEQATYSVHKLKPVTLPFELNSIVLPYKITAM